MSPRVSFPIIFVSNMERSVKFYRDVLGLPLKFQTSHWTEFGTEGTALALHAAESGGDGQPASEDLPAGRCRPGLNVANLAEFHARMLANSVPCLQEPKSVFGTLIALYVDPDGLGISVSEMKG